MPEQQLKLDPRRKLRRVSVMNFSLLKILFSQRCRLILTEEIILHKHHTLLLTSLRETYGPFGIIWTWFLSEGDACACSGTRSGMCPKPASVWLTASSDISSAFPVDEALERSRRRHSRKSGRAKVLSCIDCFRSCIEAEQSQAGLIAGRLLAGLRRLLFRQDG